MYNFPRKNTNYSDLSHLEEFMLKMIFQNIFLNINLKGQ